MSVIIGVLLILLIGGHGYGKATVSAAMQHAFDQGHMVVYQTLLANEPSVALAKRLGCKHTLVLSSCILKRINDGRTSFNI